MFRRTVIITAIYLSLSIVTIVCVCSPSTQPERERNGLVTAGDLHPSSSGSGELLVPEPPSAGSSTSMGPSTPKYAADATIVAVPIEDGNFSGYPEEIAALLRQLASEFDGDSEEVQSLLMERLLEYEQHPTLGSDLIGYSSPLFHALWSRAPGLRESARASFNDADSTYIKRILLQAMVLDDDDERYFDALEYDILNAATSTTDPLLLTDCVANVANLRNREVDRAAFDFALELNPALYEATQHPGIDGVLNGYTAIVELYAEDESVREEMRQDLQRIASFDGVNVYQFHRAIELLRQSPGDNHDLVSSILVSGTQAEDSDLASYCLARVGGDDRSRVGHSSRQ